MYGKVVWERAMWGLVGEMQSDKTWGNDLAFLDIHM